MSRDPSRARFETTPLQSGMVYHALAHPGTGVDIEHVSIELGELLNVDRLRSSWRTVAERFDVLRSVFATGRDGRQYQNIVDFSEPEFNLEDWSTLSSEEQHAARASLMVANRARGFELSEAPPIRFHVVRTGENSSWILWSFHHVILDGRSFPIVLSAWFNQYDGVMSDSIKQSDTRQFYEYAEFINNRDSAASEGFWVQNLAPVESPTTLMLSASEQESRNLYAPEMAVCEARVEAELTEQLKTFAADNGVTLNTLMQSAWALLLHHYSQQNAIVFGTTRAIRHSLDGTADTVGLLINTVPFVVQLDSRPNVLELLRQVRQLQRDLRTHETTPLTAIQQAGEVGATGLFDSLIMYDDKCLDSRMADIGIAHKDRRQFFYEGQTNFSLNLIAYGETPMQIRIEYHPGKVSDSAAQDLSEQIVALLRGFIATPELSAVEIPYMTERQLQQLAAWNQSDRPYNNDQTLHGLFEAQVNRTPEATALWFEGRSMSYREMNDRADAFAHRLRDAGVKADELVGVYAERSFEMLIGIYAVIKAGGAYVPFDPEFPDDRLAFMVEDSGARVIVAPERLVHQFPATSAEVIALSLSESVLNVEPVSSISGPRNLAYMLYTSGSTGQPKGAMIEHRSIVNRLLWMQEAYKIDESDTILQKTPYSFDVSVWELFWPLQVGARLAVANPGGHRDTKYLANIIVEQAVTTLHFVPSMLQLFVEEPRLKNCQSVRRIICSGEALPRDLQDRLFSVITPELHNLYGPTEAAVDVTWWACDASSSLNFIPIGKTIANTQIHILDQQQNPLPIGVAGELYIAGIQVGRGYHNRPELDADRFVKNPFDNTFKMYKTGDLARFLPDGNVEYMGRLDFQVKIRGQRLELGEIEAVLSAHKQVKEVVVTAMPAPSGELQLVAYVVAPGILVEDLNQHAAEFLTDFMVPSEWVIMDEFPLNTSGKVDRKKLPKPELKSENREFVSPQSETEEQVLAVWREILGRDDVGISDTFFDVGGNSLLMIRLATKLDEIFERDVSIQDLLRETTVERQAKFINGSVDSVDQSLVSASALATKQKAARAKRQRRARPGN